MRNSNPIENTGIVVRKSDRKVLGSCFLFRYTETILTAAHCTKGVSKADLAVALPSSRNVRLFDITEVEYHPTADLAVLRVSFLMTQRLGWTFLSMDFHEMSLPAVQT
jgi:S1-C subfamily serine protease